MSLAQKNPNFPTFYLSGTVTAANLAADIAAQWDLDWGTARTFTIDLWEGPSDPDDYASLTVTAGTPAIALAFTSNPPVGTLIYVLDMFHT